MSPPGLAPIYIGKGTECMFVHVSEAILSCSIVFAILLPRFLRRIYAKVGGGYGNRKARPYYVQLNSNNN